MFGSPAPGRRARQRGGSAAYLVTDDPDAVFERGRGGRRDGRCGAMVDQDYGGRGGSVADPEGNHWSFGSYQPRARCATAREPAR